jgi:hypothetical protein
MVDETNTCLFGQTCPCDLKIDRDDVEVTANPIALKDLKDINQIEKLASFFRLPYLLESGSGVFLIPLIDGITAINYKEDGYSVAHHLIDREEIVKYVQICRLSKSRIESIESLLFGLFKDVDDSPILPKMLRRY